MTKIESRCVDCQLPCTGGDCKYYRVRVTYCDSCGEEANYNIDGEDCCEECAREYLQEQFDNLSVSEKARLLNIHINEVE